MSQKIKLSVVLPCYNENENVIALIEKYAHLIRNRTDTEIIFVDNGSTDGTGEIISKTLEKYSDKGLKTTRVEINQGYGYGILHGLRRATGDYLAWSHADQQCPPEDVLKVFEAVQASADPIKCFGKGLRTNDRGRSSWLTRVQEFLTWLILGVRLKEINAQPKVFSRKLYERFQKPPNGYELDIYAYYKAVLENYTVLPVNVVFLERKFGQSKWSFSFKSKIKLMYSNFRYLIFLRFNRKTI